MEDLAVEVLVEVEEEVEDAGEDVAVVEEGESQMTRRSVPHKLSFFSKLVETVLLTCIVIVLHLLVGASYKVGTISERIENKITGADLSFLIAN